jgi:hypothetical protein
MRRDEHDRLLAQTKQYYQDALRGSGLQVNRGVVRSTATSASIPAPSWEAARDAQARRYDAETRLITLGDLGELGVRSIGQVSRAIDYEHGLHDATISEMRAVEETVTATVVRAIARYGDGCGGTCRECTRR